MKKSYLFYSSFNKKTKTGEHELVNEGGEQVMHINYEDYPRTPSIEDDALTMSRIIEKLSQEPSTIRIVFHQNKKYEYGHAQTRMLSEIAAIYNHFIKQKKIF